MANLDQRDKPAPLNDASAAEDERRRYRRYAADVGVRFRELNPAVDHEPMHQGISLNISQGGMFIKTNCFFRLGTILDVEVDVLAQNNQLCVLQMTGRVAWISFEESHPGMGIEFKDITEETRQALLAHAYRGELQAVSPPTKD